MNESTRSKLVYIFADQLRYRAYGFAGDAKEITPDMDRPATESINIVNNVAVSSMCASCCASLFAGKYTGSTRREQAGHHAGAALIGRAADSRRYRDHWTENRLILRTATS